MNLTSLIQQLNLGNRKVTLQPFTATYPNGTAAGAAFTLKCIPDKGKTYAMIGLVGQTTQGVAHRINRFFCDGVSLFYGSPVLASCFFNSDLPNGTFLFPGPFTLNTTGITYRGVSPFLLGANAIIQIEGTVATGATGNFGTSEDVATCAAVLIDVTDILPRIREIQKTVGAPNFLNIQVAALTGGAGSAGSANANTQSNWSNGRVRWQQLIMQRMDNTAGGALTVSTDFLLSIQVAEKREQRLPYQGKLPARTLALVPNAAAGQNSIGLPAGYFNLDAAFGDNVQATYNQIASPGANASTVDMLLCGFEYQEQLT